MHFLQVIFYNQTLNLWRNYLEKMTRRYSRTTEYVICHVQGWMFVAYNLYKWKKYYTIQKF